ATEKPTPPPCPPRLPGEGSGSSCALAAIRTMRNPAPSPAPLASAYIFPMQPDLFRGEAALPEGLRYRADLLSGAEESAIVHGLDGLPFREFEFHGFLGKRRVVSFGWRYDFNGGGLQQAEGLRAFLLP